MSGPPPDTALVWFRLTPGPLQVPVNLGRADMQSGLLLSLQPYADEFLTQLRRGSYTGEGGPQPRRNSRLSAPGATRRRLSTNDTLAAIVEP